MSADRHAMRQRRRGCVSVQTPPLRFMELVGLALLGGPMLVPDELGQLAESVAYRVVELCMTDGCSLPIAYDVAVGEIVPQWSRWR